MSDDECSPPLMERFDANDDDAFKQRLIEFGQEMRVIEQTGGSVVFGAIDHSSADVVEQPGLTLDPTIFDGDDYHCLSAAVVQSSIIKAYRLAVRVEMSESHRQPYPDEALLSILQKVVRFAERKSIEQRRIQPNHFFIQLESPNLDSEISLHLRSTTESALAELLEEFARVDMSNRAKGRPSVIEAPFVIDCTAIEAPKKAVKRKHSGAGLHPRIRRAKQQKGRQIKFRYNTEQSAFWELPNFMDAKKNVKLFWCLFQAIIIAVGHAFMPKKLFYQLKTRQVKQRKTIDNLLTCCRIPKFLKRYSIEDYGDRVQAYFDEKLPGQIKIFAFKNVSANMKPFWESSVEDYKIAITLFFDEEKKHFYPVKSAGQLFGKRLKYCFKCKSPYRRANSHRSSCACRCINCCRAGPEYPCPKETGFRKECTDCRKIFTNCACFVHHELKRSFAKKDGTIVESSVCSRSKRCPNCGIIYATAAHVKQPHRCDERWCLRCKSYHRSGRNCYMRFFPKSDKPARYIVYDFETRPELVADNALFRFKHSVNMCVAYVLCTECISKKVWDKPMDGWCQFCGDSRTYAWSSFAIEDGTARDGQLSFHPDVHHIVEHDSDILPAFVDWLLNFEKEVLGIEGKVSRNNIDEDEEEEDGEIVQRDLIEEMEMEERESAMKAQRCESIVYAHCGSRYDHVICFSEILQKGGLQPKITRKGNRLMQILNKKAGFVTHTSFRDTYNIMSIPLDSFTTTFDLKIPGVPGKLHFPHGFNRPENYHKKLNKLPDLEYYSPGTKFPRAKKQLEEWYAANQNTPFCLKETLAKYCYFDVLILVHGIVKMRELFMSTTNIDVTRYLTMPSACIAYFQSTLEKTMIAPNGSKYVNHTKVAIIPEMGYERRENSSVIATNWLKWKARNTGLPIQHAHSPEGEKRICFGLYAVDGYVRRPGNARGDLIIEIYGCFWHGCRVHYPNDDDTIAYGRTAGSVRKRDAIREKQIRQEGFELKIVWECEIRHKIDMDPLEFEAQLVERDMTADNIEKKVKNLEDLQKFMSEMLDSGPIEVSDAFFGGRTEPEWLSCLAGDDYTIKYKDVVSLYPTINFKTRYPIGHPTPKCWPEVVVDWSCLEDIKDPYTGKKLEGIIKGFIVPPKFPKWGVPVIPHRVGKRLLFPLCRLCAEQHPNGSIKLDYECPHNSDEERGFVFTLTHPELAKALESGYKVTRLFRAYIWEKFGDWSDTLFADYIRTWMRHKYHASGWPSNCTDERIPLHEREANKSQLFREAKERYGIILNETKMEFNPGLRFLAKLALNSLWGRLALRNRLTKTIITSDILEISRLLNNNTIIINLIEQVYKHYWMLAYNSKKEYTVEHRASNPIIALWTTSLARCHLLEQLQWVYRDQRRMSEPDASTKYPNGILRADCRILYKDTDSVLYRYLTMLGDPLLDGEHLGELKDEYPNKRITQFWCLAPKAYSTTMEDVQTGEEEHVVKTRSVTLNHDTAKKINADRVRQMVEGLYHPDRSKENFVTVDVTNNFRASRKGGIMTVPMKKKFGPTLNKGILRRNYQLAPFGWKSCPVCANLGLNQCLCMLPDPSKPTILM